MDLVMLTRDLTRYRQRYGDVTFPKAAGIYLYAYGCNGLVITTLS